MGLQVEISVRPTQLQSVMEAIEENSLASEVVKDGTESTDSWRTYYYIRLLN